MNILKQLREAKGFTHSELAKVARISVESYYDLEQYDDELDRGVSVGEITRIAKELGVSPSVLFGGSSTGAISTSDLASLVQQHVKLSGKVLAEFEDQIGYGVDKALADPERFRDFDADGLRAVCGAIGVNWLDVLDHLERH